MIFLQLSVWVAKTPNEDVVIGASIVSKATATEVVATGVKRQPRKDVRVWLGWLELYANGEIEAITTPIGYLPKYEDQKKELLQLQEKFGAIVFMDKPVTTTSNFLPLSNRKLKQ